MRRIIDAITRVLLRRTRHRRLEPSGTPVKVNLGSGLVVADGWLNVEGSLHAWVGHLPAPLVRIAYSRSGSSDALSFDDYLRTVRGHRYIPHDLRYGIPLADSTVDYILAARVLETIFLDETERLLNDAARVLRPGGHIRLCINDFEARQARFASGDRRGVIQSLFGSSDSTLLNSHRSTYDFDLIRDLLTSAGFSEVTRCSFREGKVPDLDILEHRPEEALFVEALRP